MYIPLILQSLDDLYIEEIEITHACGHVCIYVCIKMHTRELLNIHTHVCTCTRTST